MTDNLGKPITEAVQKVLDNGSTAVLITLIEAAANVGAKLLVSETGALAGSLGTAALDDAVAQFAVEFLRTHEEVRSFKVRDFAPALVDWADAQLLFERIQPEPRIVICGAGHVGAALARLASLVGYRVTLIDDRAEFLSRDLFSSPLEQGIDLVVAEQWAEAVRAAIATGRGVSLAIVTRGHKQDEDCLRAAIAANPSYIGMIGSKRRTNIVLDKLREEGAYEEQLKKVRAPIGLDIGAVSPEEVALAILAEIVAERRGGSGGSLSRWRRD